MTSSKRSEGGVALVQILRTLFKCTDRENRRLIRRDKVSLVEVKLQGQIDDALVLLETRQTVPTKVIKQHEGQNSSILDLALPLQKQPQLPLLATSRRQRLGILVALTLLFVNLPVPHLTVARAVVRVLALAAPFVAWLACRRTPVTVRTLVVVVIERWFFHGL